MDELDKAFFEGDVALNVAFALERLAKLESLIEVMQDA